MNPSFPLNYFPLFPLKDLSHMPTFSKTSFAQEKTNKQPALEWPQLGQNQMAFPVFYKIAKYSMKENVDIA